MKKILALFVLLSSLCFAHSDLMMGNLDKAVEIQFSGNPEDAIQFLDYLVNDDNTNNEDKVHYLILISNINHSIGNIKRQEYDMIKLKILINKFEECKKELEKFYPLYFNYLLDT